MTTPVISLKGAVKNYKGFTLGPIDFQVEPGMAVALVGSNGSGKSTLFRLMMNILKPDTGWVEMLGRNLIQNDSMIKQEIGYVGGMLDIFGHLTIKEMATLISHWYPRWDQQYYLALLQRYHINEKQKYAKCSTGNRKKVELIYALSHHPSILLLDEPTAGVDIISQRKMKEDLNQYMEDGMHTIVLSTHISDDVKHICDYIYILYEGSIIHSFDKDEVHDRWARLWLSEASNRIGAHPNVIEIANNYLQIVTDHLPNIESELNKEQISIVHSHPLTLDEVLSYLMEPPRS